MNELYCPWHGREHFFIEYPDEDGSTFICMVCKANERQNWKEEEE